MSEARTPPVGGGARQQFSFQQNVAEHKHLSSETQAGPRSRSSRRLSVYDGKTRLGSILPRRSAGFEAFTADGKSLGLFASRGAAANAIEEAAS